MAKCTRALYCCGCHCPDRFRSFQKFVITLEFVSLSKDTTFTNFPFTQPVALAASVTKSAAYGERRNDLAVSFSIFAPICESHFIETLGPGVPLFKKYRT